MQVQNTSLATSLHSSKNHTGGHVNDGVYTGRTSSVMLHSSFLYIEFYILVLNTWCTKMVLETLCFGKFV